MGNREGVGNREGWGIGRGGGRCIFAGRFSVSHLCQLPSLCYADIR